MATTYTSSGSTSKSYASGKVNSQTKKNYKKYNKPYSESKKVNSYFRQLNGLKKPGEFSSGYGQEVKDTYDQYRNREKFGFDVNEDVLYQQLRDQYASLGKLAMQDTMGQAASMTGGYGSSYAQTAGQQTYQNYMQQLQEQIPSIYQMELERYNQEGDNLLNQYSMAKGMYDTEYGQYRDEMSDYYADRDYLSGMYQNERNFDYGKYSDDRSYWNSEYWNQKNAAQTTKSSSYSTSKTSGTGGSSSSSKKETTKSNVGASPVPFSNEKVGEILSTAAAKGSEEKQMAYLKELYDNNHISESNLYYFMDKLGLS